MKKIFTGVIFAIFLIAVLLLANRVFKQNAPHQNSTVTPVRKEVTESHTYDELGLTFQTPKEFFVRFESQLNLTTNKPYAYTMYVQNYDSSPSEGADYQLYGIYQFDTEAVDESVFDQLSKEVNGAKKTTIGRLPALSGQIKGERQRFVTYILKDGHLLSLYTSQPTEENKKRTDQILKTFQFNE